MAKKRTTLDSVLPPRSTGNLPRQTGAPASSPPPEDPADAAKKPGRRPHVKQQSLCLPHADHRRLQILAIEEGVRQHTLLLEAVDLLFASRGLPPIGSE